MNFSSFPLLDCFRGISGNGRYAQIEHYHAARNQYRSIARHIFNLSLKGEFVMSVFVSALTGRLWY